MTYPGSVAEQVEEIRRQTIAVLDELIAKAGEFKLVEPPTCLRLEQINLAELYT
jgi:hypothetical protein